ncbi:MAG: rod shape-determining protein MreD [bacterium]
MSILFYAFLFAIAIVLQKTIAPLFSINDITPDFILILVIAFSLQQGRVRGILCAFVVGLLFDSIGTEFVGLSSLSQSVAAYLAGLAASVWKGGWEALSDSYSLSFLFMILFTILFCLWGLPLRFSVTCSKLFCLRHVIL